MFDKSYQKPPEKQRISQGMRLIVLGFLILWGASIAFALQLKTLLSPKGIGVVYDPSFDILVAVLCFILVLLGVILVWRGIREVEALPEGQFSGYLNIATAINIGLLIFIMAIAGLIFSANRAFAVQDSPLLRDEPAPDNSVPAFPTPAQPQPTPTHNPVSVYLAGPIISNFSGLRVGNIWISASKADNSINYVQVYTNRIECRVQQGNTVSTFAIDDSQQLISGPIQNQDGNFYAAQPQAVIQGVMITTASAYGTVTLHYTDPSTNQNCDLGSFNWSATATGP